MRRARDLAGVLPDDAGASLGSVGRTTITRRRALALGAAAGLGAPLPPLRGAPALAAGVGAGAGRGSGGRPRPPRRRALALGAAAGLGSLLAPLRGAPALAAGVARGTRPRGFGLTVTPADFDGSRTSRVLRARRFDLLGVR